MSLFDTLDGAIRQELEDKRHSLPRELMLGADAADRLARFVAGELGARSAVVLFDRRTRQAAGEAMLEALRAAGLEPRPLLVQDRDGQPPSCDDVTQAALQQQLPEADVVVGVGSGVISDLSKWLAFVAKRPAVIFATAASMNGYSAANVAPAIKGVKSLFMARAHQAVAADPAVLAAAPQRLTTAGLGDVIAKSVSTADWRMNCLLFGESYSAAVAGIIDGVERRYMQNPEGIAAGDPTAVGALFEALVYSGCAMTLLGTSMPASGGEHLVSHTLDMRACAAGELHDLHGRQVGLGTVVCAALYERMLALDSPPWRSAPLPLDRAGWGGLADAVAVHHQKQGVRMADAAGRLSSGDTWLQLRETLRPMLPAARDLKQLLRRAGAAHRLQDIGCDRERFLWALLNCAQMRERFTSMDLAWVTGELPRAAEAMVDEWLLQ